MRIITSMMTELGFCAIRNGKLDQAEQIFTALAEMNPIDAAGAIGLATVQLSMGDISVAMATLESGIAHAQINVHEASKLLLIACMLAGDDAKAEQIHRNFITHSGCTASDEQLQRAGAFFNQAVAA